MNRIVVYITAPNIQLAKTIAHQLVKQNIVACCNIIPQITSIYKWKGKVEEDEEVLMMCKTSTEVMDLLIKTVKENHPYENPEIISVGIEGGSKDYLDWIEESVKI